MATQARARASHGSVLQLWSVPKAACVDHGTGTVRPWRVLPSRGFLSLPPGFSCKPGSLPLPLSYCRALCPDMAHSDNRQSSLHLSLEAFL